MSFNEADQSEGGRGIKKYIFKHLVARCPIAIGCWQEFQVWVKANGTLVIDGDRRLFGLATTTDGTGRT